MGYCGLDRQRAPLSGDEIRACWESGPDVADPTAGHAIRPSALPPLRTPVPRRDFIEVRSTAELSAKPAEVRVEPPADPGPAPLVSAPRWSLWEDAEV